MPEFNVSNALIAFFFILSAIFFILWLIKSPTCDASTICNKEKCNKYNCDKCDPCDPCDNNCSKYKLYSIKKKLNPNEISNHLVDGIKNYGTYEHGELFTSTTIPADSNLSLEDNLNKAFITCVNNIMYKSNPNGIFFTIFIANEFVVCNVYNKRIEGQQEWGQLNYPKPQKYLWFGNIKN